ncbi:MAG: 50S ribosomal protein L9 [Proteobacteria bacterium]|nr:50S ribosomal protein L9 [Pseudomonadota bacterium]
MEVILLERIEKLGQMGDVVNVKPGYARNYLLPRGKALRATSENIDRFESDRGQLEATNLEQRKEAEAVAAKLEGFSCVLLRQASEGAQLYGSVSAHNIADAASETGVSLTRRQVQLDRPIKTLGVHRVRVMLHPEVIVGIDVNVARSAEEAESQATAAARPEAPAEGTEEPLANVAAKAPDEAAETAEASEDTEAPDEAGEAGDSPA